MPHDSRPLRLRHGLLTLLAFCFAFLVFVIPNRLTWLDAKSFLYLPLELFVLGLALLLPGRAGTVLRFVLALLLAAGLIFRIADMVAFAVFSRPFNPVFDSYLLADGYHFLTTSLGQAVALLTALLACALVLGILLLSVFALGNLQRVLRRAPRVSLIVLLTGIALWGGLSAAGWPRASRYFVDQLSMHVSNTLHSVADLRAFRDVVNVDRYADAPGDSLFGALRGKDVLVVFVESYGRTLVDKAEYAQDFRPALERAGEALAETGYQSRSAFLTSPTVGGISWLAHGTALSGLWIDSQVRYDSLMMSERPSLVRLFQRAGWRTVGVMPAIGMPWPEGQYFGYDHLYTAPELDYRGLPFNYVTMPDQFTLSRFQELERARTSHEPVMAEIALISSHAPWTPVPRLIDWQEVGDGSIFNAQATAGESADEVWQDRDRVLRQYRECAQYVIDALVSYVRNFGDDDLVVLILGDHQPMPYVTDNTENRDVLTHIIARDPAVMRAIDHWQWTPGMLPADEAPVWRMDEVRDRFVDAFSASTPGSAN
ncbi:MAG: hypothetical protein KDI28_02635 [Pseudomonadales bacterium]|nr:hypothetical protein [Pseudomonadales bacterium]